MSLSTEPSARKTPSGRVTLSKTKDPPPPSDSVLVGFIDLEPKDVTPLPAGKEPSIVQASSIVRPTKRTKDQPLGAWSILPMARGKTKLQFSIDR